MSDASFFQNNTNIVSTNPHEAALQSLCKQILKSRLFRGFYEERRYVENVRGYRDIISLHRSEKELDKLVKDIRDKLQMFYVQQNPSMWIGISNGPLANISPQAQALDTYLWVEMDDLAFGQYWFSVKSMRFRENEVILKLKKVRSVEAEENERYAIKSSAVAMQQSKRKSMDVQHSDITSNTTSSQTEGALKDAQVELQDFIVLLQQWWITIKHTVYDFMSNDISKDNIKGFLKFLGLLVVSILSGAIVGVKFLGIFALRFMFELSRLTHVLTPIIFKIIDVFNKIVGGFYILLAMIWKDAVVNRNQAKQHREALEYPAAPQFRSIEYDVRQRRSKSGFHQD